MIYGVLGLVTVILGALILGAWNVSTTVSTERTFNAPAAEVWKVWNDAESIQKWWGPKGYSAVVVRNDVRPEGDFLWGMQSGHGQTSWNTGTYREVVAGRRIVSTMSFSDEKGRVIPGPRAPVPGRWPDAITVIADFSESTGKAKVTVTEVGVPLIVYPLMKIGWGQQFDKIQLLL
jgi:uncharacterized protein YndB with AHSA1/START domain